MKYNTYTFSLKERLVNILKKLKKTSPEKAQELALQILDYAIDGESDNEALKDLIFIENSGAGRPKTIDEERIRELRAKGLTLSAIASTIGCSLSSVKRALSPQDEPKAKKNIKEVKYRFIDPQTNEIYSEDIVRAWGWDGSSKTIPFNFIQEII